MNQRRCLSKNKSCAQIGNSFSFSYPIGSALLRNSTNGGETQRFSGGKFIDFSNAFGLQTFRQIWTDTSN